MPHPSETSAASPRTTGANQRSADAPATAPAYLVEPAGPIHWLELFGNTQRVEIEVGCGKGLFLVSAASRQPHTNFYAIELSRKYARFAADRLGRRGLAHARVARADARHVLRNWVPSASVSVLHVYFPDPWWKRRHKKRRVFTAGFVESAARVLCTGGELRVASDVEEYFALMCQLVLAHPAFAPLAAVPERMPQHDLDYLTNFERKYRQAGRPIFRAQFRRLGEHPPARGGIEGG